MITTGLAKKKKVKKKNKVQLTRGDLMVQDDLVKRLRFLEPAQVQVWIPNVKRIRELVIQVTASDGVWAGIPWRVHARYPEKYTCEAPSFKLDPAWKIFHPNVSLEDNALCLGFTREWKPEYHLVLQCSMILSILTNLNERDPLNQPASYMVIADKENGTTTFVDLVKRTLQGGSVDVLVKEGGAKESIQFPSKAEMIAMSKRVPEEWVDAREWGLSHQTASPAVGGGDGSAGGAGAPAAGAGGGD